MKLRKILDCSCIFLVVSQFALTAALADSVYVSLNVKEEVSDQMGDILDRGSFFTSSMKQPPHITVSKFSLKNHTEEIVNFIDEQLSASLKKFKDKPMYFYADRMSVIVKQARYSNSNINVNAADALGNAYVVMKNSTYASDQNDYGNLEYAFDNQVLKSCVQANTDGQKRFKNFAADLKKLLQGQSKDGFTQVNFKKSGKRSGSEIALHPTYPHVTIDMKSEKEVDQLGSVDEVLRSFENKTYAFQTPKIEKDCSDFIRYRVTGYFIQWTAGNQSYKKFVRIDDL